MLTLTIETDSAAFSDDREGECADILHYVEMQLRAGYTGGPLMDYNGNSVGKWQLTAPPTRGV